MAKMVTDEENALAMAFYEANVPPDVEAVYPQFEAIVSKMPAKLHTKLYAATMYALINLNAMAEAVGEEPKVAAMVKLSVPLAELADVYRTMAAIIDRVKERVK